MKNFYKTGFFVLCFFNIVLAAALLTGFSNEWTFFNKIESTQLKVETKWKNGDRTVEINNGNIFISNGKGEQTIIDEWGIHNHTLDSTTGQWRWQHWPQRYD